MQSRTSAYKIAFYTECEETLIPFFLAHLQRFPRKTHNTDVIGSLVSVVWNLPSNIYEGLVQQVHTVSSSTLTRIYSVFSNFLLFSLHSIAYRRDQLSLFSTEHTVSILGILRHLESRMQKEASCLFAPVAQNQIITEKLYQLNHFLAHQLSLLTG